MDPVTIVVAALVAGVTAGLTETAKIAVGDLYKSLKTKVITKIEKSKDAQQALIELEKKPESKGRQETLKEELEALQVEKDSELLALARELLEKLDSKNTESGKYDVHISNSPGIVIGDYTTVEQNFGDNKKRSRK